MGRDSFLFNCVLWRAWETGEGAERKREEERGQTMNLLYLRFIFPICPAAVGREESEKMNSKASSGSTTLGSDDSSLSGLPTHVASLPG